MPQADTHLPQRLDDVIRHRGLRVEESGGDEDATWTEDAMNLRHLQSSGGTGTVSVSGVNSGYQTHDTRTGRITRLS